MTSNKTNYCHNCQKYFHPLGIMRHRAMHRDRKEQVKITSPAGTYTWGKAIESSNGAVDV